MWCPFCSHENTRVVDSRLTRDGMQIRRRRQCESCASRFNTYEAPELKAPRIIKADGAREAFSEQKLREGMLRALEKRPVETRQVERTIRSLHDQEGMSFLIEPTKAHLTGLVEMTEDLH